MNVISQKCEFCAFYEDDFYETHCFTCRVDEDSPTDHRNFILLPELVELKRLAEIGRAYLKWMDVMGQRWKTFDKVAIPDEQELIEWAEGVSND